MPSVCIGSVLSDEFKQMVVVQLMIGVFTRLSLQGLCGLRPVAASLTLALNAGEGVHFVSLLLSAPFCTIIGVMCNKIKRLRIFHIFRVTSGIIAQRNSGIWKRWYSLASLNFI